MATRKTKGASKDKREPIPPLPDRPITTPPGGGPQPIDPLPDVIADTLGRAPAEIVNACGLRNGMTPAEQYAIVSAALKNAGK